MDWLAVRDRFPRMRRKGVYYNSCSMGSPADTTLEALHTFMEQWTQLGASAWYELWLAEMAAWRKGVARLVGARPDEIAWTPSVSAALSSLSGALDRQDRNGKGRYAGRRAILAGDLEFPTAVATFGVRPDTPFVWAKSPDGIQVPATAYAQALEGAKGKGPGEVQAVVASRVFYTTGAVQDVKSISAAARKAGALAIVDDYQATGQLPFDFAATGADVAVGGSLKWLCGGVGCGWMAVRKPLIRSLEPTHSGWWANAGMFEFRTKGFRFWDDARRFEGGEVHLPSLFTSRASIDLLNRLGASRIAARNRELTRDLVDRLEEKGFTLRIHPDAARRSAIVMVEAKDAKRAVARLAKAGVIVDDRPGCVRLSPHFYNTAEENAAVVAALRKATV